MSPNNIRREHLRANALSYARRFLLLPYYWGGDDPLQGFDCSGFVIEILTAVGVLPHKYDNTAGGLFERFEALKVIPPGYGGCLVFYFNGTIARPQFCTHVEMLMDQWLQIGASGGGSATTSLADAIIKNAFIKMRPVGYRKGLTALVDPFLSIQ